MKQIDKDRQGKIQSYLIELELEQENQYKTTSNILLYPQNPDIIIK